MQAKRPLTATVIAIALLTACDDYKIKTDRPITSEQSSSLNCRAFISPLSTKNKPNQQASLIFVLKKNPDFKTDLVDDCKGDLKNIWRDLSRFENEIESHSSNISHISSTASKLNLFPETLSDLQTYMKNAAIRTGLDEKLNRIDRSTLEGGMKFNNEVVNFIRENEREYWMTEHAPIIENALSQYNLSMKTYSTEKEFYCHHSYDSCNIEPRNKDSTNEKLEFEYFGSGFAWFLFQKPIEK